MKTLKSRLLIPVLLTLVGFFAASCSEDPVTLITDKIWVIESVNMAGMDMTPAEILASEGAEYQMTLKADGTVVYADNMGMNNPLQARKQLVMKAAARTKWHFMLSTAITVRPLYKSTTL